MTSFLFSYYDLFVSTQLGWLKWLFDILTWLFEMVGLKTNVQKKIGMICQPFHIIGEHSYAAYSQ